MAPVLGYWKLRGLCQSIRMLLEYTGTEYEEKLYHFGPAPDYDKSEWLDEKFNLGLDFPNLPYYIDGSAKVTQSNAILRYVARKHDLLGRTDEERVRVDVLENQAMDLRMSYVRLVYQNYNTQKKEYLDNLPGTLKMFSNFLGNRKWFAGESLTFVDFLMYELLDIHLELDASCLASSQNLSDFHKRFEELPAIKKYMASPRFIKKPLNGPMALFDIK
ncbi:glutathione S-transferase Mu 4-like [Penaeus chinensis]|uniref:glutathione S-transferase Mu 4-like n=1 Tax=Penaeus chinensis TaxID=139456 RepID=UPI001FB7A5DC|nr:glutathione S-transferase Mu 4-like [Penaeus chinensis]